jgi:hypothetical protein
MSVPNHKAGTTLCREEQGGATQVLGWMYPWVKTEGDVSNEAVGGLCAIARWEAERLAFWWQVQTLGGFLHGIFVQGKRHGILDVSHIRRLYACNFVLSLRRSEGFVVRFVKVSSTCGHNKSLPLMGFFIQSGTNHLNALSSFIIQLDLLRSCSSHCSRLQDSVTGAWMASVKFVEFRSQ